MKRVNNNAKIHPRNLYKDNPPDFVSLAKLHPSFAPFVHISESAMEKESKCHFNWKDPEALIALTKVLLLHDFGLTVELPVDQLCPTVTSRLNYILWIEDLLNSSTLKLSVGEPAPKKKKFNARDDATASGFDRVEVRGIDIGTGASCIYPLLGVATNDWHFLATDIDARSLAHAARNVALNSLHDRIELVHIDAPSTVLMFPRLTQELERDPNRRYDFCMCNPPFFTSLDQKSVNPKSVCLATQSELVTEGGEVQLISQMIADSLVLREKITWYTSLVGRFVNVKILRKELVNRGIRNIKTTAFYQGNTTRWAIAWSFLERDQSQCKTGTEALSCNRVAHELDNLVVKWKLIHSMREKRELSLLVPATSIDGASSGGMKELLAKIETFGRERQAKFSWLAAECKFRVNIYDDSQWWRDVLEDARHYNLESKTSSFEDSGDLDKPTDGVEDLDLEFDGGGCEEHECFDYFGSPSESESNNPNEALSPVCGPTIPTLVASCEISVFLQRNNKDYLLQFRKTYSATEPLSEFAFSLLYYELKQYLADYAS